MDKLYTINQVCTLLNVGRSTLYREHEAGRIKFKKIGRATRIAASDLDDWLSCLPAKNPCS